MALLPEPSIYSAIWNSKFNKKVELIMWVPDSLTHKHSQGLKILF